MGSIEKEDKTYVYRQDDGEVTAQFESIEEKMVLGHEGTPFYRRVFNLLVVIGALYLAAVLYLNGFP